MPKQSAKQSTRARIIIVSIDKGDIYGPFDDVNTARDWIEAPHDAGKWAIYSIWDREAGTQQTAHACGRLLQSKA